ncbi:MAG: high frequency lysogenization protein HflD [Gammaproteobacteria bacterium]|nr:high frequency lysogenization protein HflD [Gammaproteobacteria bacterium]
MSNALTDQVIALAAVAQAASLVQQVARHGTADEDAVKALLGGILETDPDSTDAVFGGLAQLRPGLSILQAQLTAQGNVKDVEITRYVISLLALERRLAAHPSTLSMLGERIGQVKRQLDMQELMDERTVAGLASIYVELISPLGPRIQVAGNANLLKTTAVQNQLRALLLAGLRAAVLWRQVGGRRLQLLFNRKRIGDTARYLLQSLNQS